MKARTVLLFVVLLSIAIFTALNWAAFMAPTTLSLGVTDVQAPLGLVMLGMLVSLSALFLVFVLYLQTTVLLDARRHSKELHSQRELADQAEASRFTELRAFLDEELKKLAIQNTESKAALLARMDQLDGDLRTMIEQTGNGISAYIGVLDGRLEKKS